MNEVVKYFNTIEGSFKRMKVVTIGVLTAAAIVAVGSVVYSYSFLADHSDNIYILDRGTAYSATKAGAETIERENEAIDHVKRFHEYFFNLYPSRDAIQSSIESALGMCDQSAYDYYQDQQEKGYYSRLIQNNVSQYITVDSVKVNMLRIPYMERTYGKVYVLRESNITAFRFESSGQLIDVGRSKNNPHGLMLEQFAVTRYDKIETRRRN